MTAVEVFSRREWQLSALLTMGRRWRAMLLVDRRSAKVVTPEMQAKILTSAADLEVFAHRFGKRGNPVALDYLRRAQVRAFFDSRGNMFAGYVLNLTDPLRYIDWVPEVSRGHLPMLAKHRQLGELTCIWIYGREGRVSSERIYLNAVCDALRSRASFVLGGTLSSVVYGIQSQLLPRIVYSGPTTHFGEPRHCWIYGATRNELRRRLAVSLVPHLVKGFAGRPDYLAKARRLARGTFTNPSGSLGARSGR